jgi:hypothetical protein
MMKDMSVHFSNMGNLAQALAAHYGGAAVCNMGKAGNVASSAWHVSVDGERLVTLCDNGLNPIWLFVGQKAAMSRDVWMLSEAVSFIDLASEASEDVGRVMSDDGVTFQYSVEYWVTIRGGEVVSDSKDAEFIGVFNAETLEDLTGEDLDLVVNAYGPIADARAERDMGLSS